MKRIFAFILSIYLIGIYADSLISPCYASIVPGTSVPRHVTIDTSKGVGEIPIESGLSPSGAKTYTVPLKAADGINNFQPSLSLCYNSHQNNSAVGVGWSVSGLSQIVRGSKTLYYDDTSQGIQMDNTDAFLLDGVHLIKKSVDGNSILYETETGHIKVRGHTSNDVLKFFEVYYPNGNSGIFGYVSNSGNKLFYPLTALSDLSGNTIYFNYIFSGNHYLISSVSYSNVQIDFQYNENRQDSIIYWVSGIEIAEHRLLEAITCKRQSQELWTYELGYSSSLSGKSLLTRVDYKSQSEYLNPIRFYYNTEPASTNLFDQTLKVLGDFNVWHSTPNELRVCRGRFNYANGSDGVLTFPNTHPYWEQATTSAKRFINKYQGTETIYVYDNINPSGAVTAKSIATGIGFIDLLCADVTGIHDEDIIRINEMVVNNTDQLSFTVFRSANQAQLQQRYTRTFNLPTVYNDNHGHKSIHPKVFFSGDFDGDGRMEICAVSIHNPFDDTSLPSICYIFDLEDNTILYQGSLFPFHKQLIGNTITNAEAAYNNSDKLFIIDFNGDGKSDICYIGTSGLSIYTFSQASASMTPVTVVSNSSCLTRASLANRRVLVNDFNGDGLSDILVSPLSTEYDLLWTKYTSKGNGTFKAYSFQGFTYETYSTSDFLTQDINNDGLCDLIKYDSSQLYVMQAEGSGFCENVYSADLPASNMTVVPVNGRSRDLFPNLIGIKNYQLALLRYTSSHEYESLVVGMANSLGLVEHNTYDLMTSDDGCYEYNSANDSTSYPFAPFYEPIPLLASSSLYMDNTQTDHKSYRYQNAMVHARGRGFQGFGKITSTNFRNQETVQTFDPTRFGIMTALQSPLSNVTYSYSISVQNDKQASIRLTGKSETDLLKGFSATSSLTYDGYDNLTSETKVYSDGTTVTRVKNYNNHGTGTWASGYMLGCLFNEKVTTYYNGDTYEERYFVPTFSARRRPLVEISYKNGNKVYEKGYTYDSHDNIVAEYEKPYTSPAPMTTSCTYDSRGLLTSKTDIYGNTTTYNYNAKGNLISETDIRGGTTNYSYDSFGRLSGITSPDSTVSTTSYAWTVGSPTGLYKITQTTTGKPTTVTYYDALNREVRLSDQRFDGSFRNVDKTYDEWGNLSGETLPFKTGNGLSPNGKGWCYDEFGRMTEYIYAQGAENTYEYDGLTVSETNGTGQTTERTYDVLGRLVSVTDATGTITYNLAADGQPISITAPGNITTSFTYDQYRRRTSLSDPSAGTTTYTYDNAGNIESETDARDSTTTFVYDLYNRLITVVRPEFTTTRTYNTYCDIVSEVSTNGTYKEYSYDEYGNISSLKEGVSNVWLQKDYYRRNNLIDSIRYTSQYGYITTENYEYNNGHFAKGWIARKNPKNNLFATIPVIRIHSENELGQATYISSDNLQRHYSYSSIGYCTRRMVRHRKLVITPKAAMPIFDLYKIKQDFRYSYNNVTGNLTSRTDAKRDLTENFGYDAHSRLTTFGGKSASYDDFGNILSLSDIGSFEYDTPQKPYAISGVTPLTDNLFHSTEQNITYTSFRRPARITEGNVTTSFQYTAGQDRAEMTTIRIRYPRRSVTVERYAGGNYEHSLSYSTPAITPHTSERLYLFGDYYSSPAVLCINDTTQTLYYILRDQLGSITHVIGEDLHVEQELSYDAWGRLRDPETHEVYSYAEQPTLFLGRGYCGHEHLPQFGLINMNARLYDPALGRFLSPDPYVQMPDNSQSFNRYTYCLNNPLKYKDPSGELFIFDDWIIGALKGLFNGENVLKSANRHAKNSLKIWAGLFALDSNKNFFQKSWEFVSRFTWQLPQTGLGFMYAHTGNMLGDVSNVWHIYGATVLRQRSNWLMGNGAAVTIGSYITGGDKIVPDAHNSLFQHEYGHYLQSQAMGPLFLLTVGEPSLWNAAFGSKHDFQSYERDANYRAFKYFNKNLRNFSSSNWDFFQNPLTRNRYDTIDYNNPNDLKRVEHSLQKFYLFF